MVDFENLWVYLSKPEKNDHIILPLFASAIFYEHSGKDGISRK
jgi:hypothetical protein